MILKLKELLSFFAKIALVFMLKLLTALSVDDDGTTLSLWTISLMTGFSLKP